MFRCVEPPQSNQISLHHAVQDGGNGPADADETDQGGREAVWCAVARRRDGVQPPKVRAVTSAGHASDVRPAMDDPDQRH